MSTNQPLPPTVHVSITNADERLGKPGAHAVLTNEDACWLRDELGVSLRFNVNRSGSGNRFIRCHVPKGCQFAKSGKQTVARLIAARHGMNPSGRCIVYLDGDVLNLRPSNLSTNDQHIGRPSGDPFIPDDALAVTTTRRDGESHRVLLSRDDVDWLCEQFGRVPTLYVSRGRKGRLYALVRIPAIGRHPWKPGSVSLVRFLYLRTLDPTDKVMVFSYRDYNPLNLTRGNVVAKECPKASARLPRFKQAHPYAANRAPRRAADNLPITMSTLDL